MKKMKLKRLDLSDVRDYEEIATLEQMEMMGGDYIGYDGQYVCQSDNTYVAQGWHPSLEDLTTPAPPKPQPSFPCYCPACDAVNSLNGTNREPFGAGSGHKVLTPLGYYLEMKAVKHSPCCIYSK